jgi:upstream activation factor subunit UAF30
MKSDLKPWAQYMVEEMASVNETPVTLELLAKELKGLRKDVRKIRQYIGDPSGEKAAERAKNNGFNKPQSVTPALQKFLGLADGDKISRTQVTKFVNAYVSERGLKNGKVILMDDTLRALLNPPEGEEVSFLNLQKFVSPHYIKEVKPPAPPKEKKPVAVKEKPVAAEAATEAPKEKKVRPKVVKSAA